MAAPTNQEYLQISFALTDENEVDFFTFPIKPEELTRTDPSRAAVVNSLDGAWVDSFGRGLSTLSISGNTGWRGTDKGDGGVQFTTLRDNFIHKWHALRRQYIEKGKDPNEVRLIYIDAVNGKYVADVVPMNFVLRRSKSHPLLYMYSMTLVAIKEGADNPFPYLLEPILPPVTPESFLQSVMSSVSAVSALLTSAAGFFGKIGPLGTAALNLINGKILPAIAKALDLVRLASSIGVSIGLIEKAAIATAGTLAATGVTAMNAITSMSNLPAEAEAAFMAIKSKLSGLGNTLSIGIPALPTIPKLP